MSQRDPKCSNPQCSYNDLEGRGPRAGAPSPPLGGEERVGEKERGSGRTGAPSPPLGGEERVGEKEGGSGRTGAPSPPLGGAERVGEKEGGSGRFPNAFSADFLTELARRDPAPAAPEADLAGPWRVTALYGAGADPRWACIAAGEHRPRLTLQAPDLAYLAAAAFAVAERADTAGAFRFQEDADRRLHLLWHGRPVGTSLSRGDTLPLVLGALADLRVQPLAFAHYLLSVPDETLRRSGRILMELLREAGR